MIEAAGAPFDQGFAQGRSLGPRVRDAIRELRTHYGMLSWWDALATVQRGPGRATRRFMPQQFERLQGIARGAGVRDSALVLHASTERVQGVGTAGVVGLEARLEVPSHVERLLVLRTTRPDAGGFASVELTAAPWTGALAGVNACGVAMVVLDDRSRAEPSMRVLGQDALLRGETLETALEHLRLRASYAGGTGALLLCDGSGAALRVTLERGTLLHALAPRASIPPDASDVWIDAKAHSLVWRAAGERVEEATLPTPDAS